ncbi:MFS transporter [Myxococcota bacterium]|nr:MFS transporter [Myxococcota bacterium]
MTEAETPTPKKSMLRSFPRAFWIANVMELFERGAYYGMNAVLAVYLTNKTGGALGLSEDKAGFLQGIIYALTYVIPILGGALADRYGYRRMLMIAFTLLTGGYYLSAFAGAYWKIFITLALMALGAGLFKPIISGTIARTTTPLTSGFGFGLYYWMINFGALVSPLIISVLHKQDWSYVFLFSGTCTLLMFIPAIFLYRDPPKPASTKSLSEVLKGAAVVLSDSRFMLMVFIYSLFWILYFQNFGTVLWYLRDFLDPTPVNQFFAGIGINLKLGPEHVTVINAGTIVFLQVVVSLFTKKIPPLPSMMLGIGIGSVGFFILAISSSVWLFVLGIAVFSIGEMTCHPKYYSYIGIVAPAEKKAVYMGYAFLYGVIGSLVGANVGGEMYHEFLAPFKGAPNAAVDQIRSFWMTFGALGLVSMGSLFVYNRVFGKDTPHTRILSRRIMFIVYILFCAIGALFISWQTAKGKLVPKTVIQSAIMISIGVLGIWVSLRLKHPDDASGNPDDASGGPDDASGGAEEA